MAFGEEEGFGLSDFVEMFGPEGVLFLVRDCYFDEDILFVGPLFDDLAIGKALVIDFGDFFALDLRNRFRLGVTHYSCNINQISIL